MLKLQRKVLPGISLICAFGFAHASEDIGLTKQFSACVDKSRGVTATMVECAAAETKRQDARLNKAYKELMAGPLSPARKKQLQEAQRAWIRFRDANCDFYLDPDGGSAARLSANDCVMSATARRATELADMTP